jgi:integrase
MFTARIIPFERPSLPACQLEGSILDTPASADATIPTPPVRARKRGKCMTRRTGQNPKVRIKKRADGTEVYFFQYWKDIPGQEDRSRETEVIGLLNQMTQSEAERKKTQFIMSLGINSDEYRIPSSKTFADAERHYREVFAPRMLRGATYSVAKSQIACHLLPEWKDTPIEHITINTVNEWAWKKRGQGLSWVTIKNILRTMQRVLSCYRDDRKPPFSQEGLAIPDKDKLRMKLDSRQKTVFSWDAAGKLAAYIRTIQKIGTRAEKFAALVTVESASGLRWEELAALRMNDLDFKASTIRVDEALDREQKIGPCKNAAAYRTILLADREGQRAMRTLKAYVGKRLQQSEELVFCTSEKTPLQLSQVLREALHPALKALGLPQDGMRPFRRGCNRRWELAGMNPAVLRQQMGHSSAGMTYHYTGEIPLSQVRESVSKMMETMETDKAA